jgi:DNA-directed RNA polymerase I subunit RPA1
MDNRNHIFLPFSVMDIAVPVDHEIVDVSFSFFDSEDTKKISVKQINNPVTFDPMTNHPNKNGLYDNALGPFDKNQLCGTCKLNYFTCPGHFGHIELAVPVYHPLLFKSLFNLLRSTCFYCHRFKMNANKVYRYVARLKLLNAGLVLESMELASLDLSGNSLEDQMERGESTEDQGEEGDGVEDEGRIRRMIDAYVKRAFEKHGINPKKVAPNAAFDVSLTNDCHRQLTKEFLLRLPSIKKCENCGGRSPTLRKEANSKIFEAQMTKRDQQAMDAQGLRQQSLFNSADAAANDDDDDVHMQETDANEGDDEDVKASGKSSYLTPIQVREHMRLLWEAENQILDFLYGVIQSNDLGRPQRISSFKQFFLDVIAVPPSRFRPMSRLGDKVFDHSQNVYLSEVIKSNNMLVEIRSQEKNSNVEDKTKEAPEAMLKRLVNTWVTLQESVNNLHDSSKNPKSKVMPPGIKQIMEKKEGLFRKHMMVSLICFIFNSLTSSLRVNVLISLRVPSFHLIP